MMENNHIDKIDVLSVYFDNVTLLEMRNNIKRFFLADEGENLFIVTANPEIVDYATENEAYR